MTISGPQALKSLDDAIRNIRVEEQDITSRLTHSTETISKLRDSEGEQFTRLARLRLSPEMQAQIVSDLSVAEQSARNVIERRSQSLRDLDAQVVKLDKRIAKFAHDRRDALTEVEAQQKALSDLSDEIAAAISGDPDYAEKRKAADEMRAVAEESLKKTRTAEEDRETKGRPYRDDPLFIYLWEAGYGTRNYKANNLVRWLDSLVARLIRYHDARPNYAMLNEIPLRLREHAERQIAAADEADAALDEIENRAIDKAGGGPIRTALEKAQQQVDEIDTKMVEAEDQRDQLTRDIADFAEQDDPALEVAVKGLAGSLQSTQLSQLIDDARRTPTHEDDAILSQIDDLRLRIVDEETEGRELRERLKVLARRRRELEDIEFEFKKSKFDDPRSHFKEDDLVGDLLGEFLRGAISASTYWGHWKRSQNWRADTSDWGGSIGLPNSGRRSNWPNITLGSGSNWGSFGSRPSGKSSGGFSRPRSSAPRSGSRGSRRSGGFKTGGGF